MRSGQLLLLWMWGRGARGPRELQWVTSKQQPKPSASWASSIHSTCCVRFVGLVWLLVLFGYLFGLRCLVCFARVVGWVARFAWHRLLAQVFAATRKAPETTTAASWKDPANLESKPAKKHPSKQNSEDEANKHKANKQPKKRNMAGKRNVQARRVNARHQL